MPNNSKKSLIESLSDEDYKSIGFITPEQNKVAAIEGSKVDFDPTKDYKDFSSLGDSQFDKEYNRTQDTNIYDITSKREELQGLESEITNAIVGGAAKSLFTLGEQVGYIADLDNYTSNAGNYDNVFSQKMREIKGDIGEALPIYGSEDKGSLGANLGNREWWMGQLEGAVDSGVAFAALGYGTGAILRGVLGTVGKGTGLLANTIKKTGVNIAAYEAAGQGLGTLSSAALSTHAEGVGLAVDVYDNALKIASEDYIKKYQLDNNLSNEEMNLQINDEDFAKKVLDHANTIASIAASTAHSVNMINTLFNITGINRMFTSPKMTRDLIKQATIKSLGKEWGIEMAQEAIEENINNIASNKAITEAKGEEYDLSNVMNDVFSKEGIESAIGGALGALATSGSIDAKKLVSGDFKKQNDLYDQLVTNDSFLNSVQGQKSLTTLINNVDNQKAIINNINKFTQEGKDKEADVEKRKLLQYQAFQSFKVGNAKQFEDTIDSILKSPESKQQFGEDITETATKYKNLFKEAEQVYNESIFNAPENIQEPLYYNKIEEKNLSKDLNYTKDQLSNSINNLQVEKLNTTIEENGESLVQENQLPSYSKVQEYKQQVELLTNQLVNNYKQHAFITSSEFIKKKEEVTTKYKKVKEDTVNNLKVDKTITEDKIKAKEFAKQSKEKIQQKENVISPESSVVQPSQIDSEQVQPSEMQEITPNPSIPQGVEENIEQPSEEELDSLFDESKKIQQTLNNKEETNKEKRDKIEYERKKERVEAISKYLSKNKQLEKEYLKKYSKTEILKNPEKYMKDYKEFSKDNEKANDDELRKIDEKYDNLLKETFLELNNEEKNAIKINEAIILKDINIPSPIISENKQKELSKEINNAASNTEESTLINGVQYVGKKLVTGWNAVASKSRDSETIVENGNTYEKDINDEVSNSINQNILSTNGLIDIGTEVIIEPTRNNNRLKRDKENNNQIIEVKNDLNSADQEFVIKDVLSGSIIGYLHDEAYMDEDRIVENEDFKDNIEKNKKELSKLRNTLLNYYNTNPIKSYRGYISGKSVGALAFSANKQYSTLTENTLGDKRPKLSIVKIDGLYVNENRALDILNSNNDSLLDYLDNSFYRDNQGLPILLLPTSTKTAEGGINYYPCFIKSEKINQDIKNSILNVTSLFINNNWEALSLYDINDIGTLKSYLDNFIYNTFDTESPYYIDFDLKYNTIKFYSRKDNSIIPWNKEIDNQDKFNIILDNRDFNLNLKSNEKEVTVKIMDSGGFPKEISYKDLAFDNFSTNVKGFTLNQVNDEVAYFHNPVISFDTITEYKDNSKVETIRETPTSQVVSERKRPTRTLSKELGVFGKPSNKLSSPKTEIEFKGLLKDNLTGQYISVEKVNDIVDSIYTVVVRNLNSNNKDTVSNLFDKYIKMLDEVEELYKYFGEEGTEITSEDIEEGIFATNQENQDYYETFSKEADQIKRNFDSYKEFTIDKLNSFGYKIKNNSLYNNENKQNPEIGEDINKDESSLTKYKYDDSNFEKDPVTNLSARVKGFLSTIDSGNDNYLGFKRYVDFVSLHNELMGLLSNQYLSFNEILNTIKEKSIDKPYMKNLYDSLLGTDERIQNEFTSHFGKQYAEFITVTYSETNANAYNSFETNRNTLDKFILSNWESSITSTVYKTNFEGIKELSLNPNVETLWAEIAQSSDPNTKQVQLFLKELGINISLKTLEYIKTNTNTKSFEKQYGIKGNWTSQFGSKGNNKGLFGNIYSGIKDVKTINEDSSILEKEGALSTLSKIDSVFSDTIYTNSHVNGEGKTIYSYALPNFTTIRFKKLFTNQNNIVNKLKQIPFTKYASWLEVLSNDNLKSNIKIYYLDSLKLDLKGQKGKSIDVLDDVKKQKLRIGLFTGISTGKNNVILTKTLTSAKSDKTTATIIQHPKVDISLRETTEGYDIDNKTIDKLVDIAMSEYTRYLHAQENPELTKDIKGYVPKAFYLITQLNDDNRLFETKIVNDKQTKILKSYTPEVASAIRETVVNAIKEEIDSTYSFWQEKDIINKGEIKVNNKYRQDILNKKPFSNKPLYTVADFVINNYIANYNYIALFSGDVAFTGKKTVQDSIDNYFKRLAKDIAPAQRVANSKNDSYKQIYIADPNGEYRVSKNIEQIKQIIGEKKAKDYEDIDIADAQEYSTLNEHLRILYLQGKINRRQYSILSFKSIYSKRLGKELVFNDEELSLIFQPMKPVYVGTIPNVEKGIDQVIYIKSSTFPLIPQLTKGTKLDTLRKQMEKYNIARAALTSAIKVGAEKVLSFDKIGESNLNNHFTILNREDFGIQQEIPYDEEKEKVLEGSQLSKLIFESINDPELKDLFNKLHIDLMGEGYQSLKEDFGFQEDSEGNIIIEDFTKFREVLINELKTRDYNINDIDSLRLDENNKLIIPLVFNNQADRFETLLISIFKQRVLKQKLPGRSFILGSELGFEEDLNSNQKNDIVYSSSYNKEQGLLPQRLVYIDENGNDAVAITKEDLAREDLIVRPAQVMVAFNYKDNEGNLLNIEDFTNSDGSLNESKITQEMRELIGYRIPTQGHNSMSYIEIVGFLPKGMGDLIIASKDWTKQMGSDFDIDKLYTHRKNYSYNEGLISSDVEDITKQKQNDIVDIYFKVLKDKQTFEKIITPLDFGMLPDIKKQLLKIEGFENKPKSILSPLQQDRNFENGVAGKVGVGRTSLLSTFSSLIQNKGIELATDLKFKIKGKIYSVKDLSSSTILGGLRSKLSVIAAFQSASVDNIKELLVNIVNYNEYTHDVLTTLGLLGLEEDYISYFLTQDSVKAYVDFVKNNNITNIETLFSSFVNEYFKNLSTEEIKFVRNESLNDIDNISYSSEELYDLLSKKIKDNTFYIQQSKIIHLLYQYVNYGKAISNVQNSLNLANSGSIKGVNSVKDKLDQFKVNYFNEDIINTKQLFGEVEEDTDINGNLILIPSNKESYAIEIYRKAFNMLNNIYPYRSKLFTTLNSSISQKVVGIKKDELYKRILNFTKASIISDINLVGRDINLERQQLFFGENSVAKRWKILNESNPNFVSKRLQIEVNDEQNNPDLIKYTSTSVDKTDSLNITKTIVEMLNSDNEVESELMRDTIKYMYLATGVQNPISLIKYIPNNYLIENGFGKDVNINWNNDELVSKYKDTIENQFFQHNIDILPQLKKKPSNLNKLVEFAPNGNKANKDFTYSDFVNYYDADSKQYYLYKVDQDTKGTHRWIYNRIDVLGTFGMNEFNINEINQKSLIFKNQSGNNIVSKVEVKQSKESTINPNPYLSKGFIELGIKDDNNKQDIINILNTINNTSNSKTLKLLSQVLLNNSDKLPNNIRLQVEKLKDDEGTYFTDKNLILIDSQLIGNNIERVVMEEIVHAYTVDALRNPNKYSKETQEAVISLKRLFETSKEKYSNLNNTTEDEFRKNKNIYGFSKIEEFVARSLTSSEFQKTLNNIDFTDNKSVLGRFWEILSKLIKGNINLTQIFEGLKVKDESALKNALIESFNLLNIKENIIQERTLSSPKEKSLTNNQIEEVQKLVPNISLQELLSIQKKNNFTNQNDLISYLLQTKICK